MNKKNIVISGLGSISAAGNNLAETLNNFNNEIRNAGPISLFNTELKCPVFEVKNIPEKYNINKMRTLSLALCAVKEALADANLNDNLEGFRVGVCLGTTVASQLNDLDFYSEFKKSGKASMDSVDRFLKGNIAESISRMTKAKGPFCTVVNACSSGTDAVGIALSWLKSGQCDIAIAGGADELNRIPLCGFTSMGIVSNSLCAPFDKERHGLNLGEGAGVLILETDESARKRNKKTSLFLKGYGSVSDSYHLTAPDPEGKGLEKAIYTALDEAGIVSKDICFINAHGTATRDNDKIEAVVFKKIFGSEVLFFSTKGYTGHTLGAAGGLEGVFTAAALKERWIPSNVGFKNMDDEIQIIPVTKKTNISGYYAISTSLAFGGNNSVLVLGCTD